MAKKGGGGGVGGGVGDNPRHGLLVALVIALVGLVLLVFAALAVAPVLVIVLGVMSYTVWWYVSREDTSFMHHAQVSCWARRGPRCVCVICYFG